MSGWWFLPVVVVLVGCAAVAGAARRAATVAAQVQTHATALQAATSATDRLQTELLRLDAGPAALGPSAADQ